MSLAVALRAAEAGLDDRACDDALRRGFRSCGRSPSRRARWRGFPSLIPSAVQADRSFLPRTVSAAAVVFARRVAPVLVIACANLAASCSRGFRSPARLGVRLAGGDARASCVLVAECAARYCRRRAGLAFAQVFVGAMIRIWPPGAVRTELPRPAVARLIAFATATALLSGIIARFCRRARVTRHTAGRLRPRAGASMANGVPRTLRLMVAGQFASRWCWSPARVIVRCSSAPARRRPASTPTVSWRLSADARGRRPTRAATIASKSGAR